MRRRIERWVQHHLTAETRPGLPRSSSSLLRALRTDLGSLRRQVMEPQALFQRLVRDGYVVQVLEHDEGGAPQHGGNHEEDTRPLTFHVDPKPLGSPKRTHFDQDGTALPASTDDAFGELGREAHEAMMRKVIQWIARMAAHPHLRPATVEAAQKTLAQLALVNLQYPPENLQRYLEERGYIRLVPCGQSVKVEWLLEKGAEKRKQESDGERDHRSKWAKRTSATTDLERVTTPEMFIVSSC